MANIRVGLSYYSVDTDRYLDIRIRRLVKAFGCDGIAVYDYLLCNIYLCNIYRVKGCFAAWDESTAFNVAEYLRLKESVVLEIVRYCGVVGLFNKELLSRGIITSAAIQRRYIDTCIRAKRKNLEIPEFCRILPEETAKLPEESPNTPEFCREVKKSIISSPYVEDINNPPLYPPEGEEDYIPTEFVTLWDKFKGKRKSLTDDYKDFCKKTEGLVIDYVKLQRSAQFAKNVYFQTWLNDFFPKKSRRNIDLSAVEPAFQPIMADWLAYKSERGQTYRPLGLQRCYVRLLTLSGNDAAKARRIVDFSIANNYSGLFPPHDQDNSANRHPATDYHAQPGQTYEDF
ncbi:DUF4373 domain-containing protein [Alistipes putredinis]|uniref:DUF4373 domain-containing protein n=1 Tax=Alistipes putredinis TaxID=28117 RepID=UPI003A91DF55